MLTGDLPRGAWEPPGKLTSGASVRLDEVVTRAIADLDAVINELADFQPALDDYKKRGVTRYWTENEQQIQKLRLDDLSEKVRTRTAVAFARDDPRVKEAQQRLAALAGAHKAMQLPELSNGNCVSPEFRANNPAAGCFIDGEVIPGVRLVFWQGQHQYDCASYCVEPLAIELEKPISFREPTLEDYPDFWPLDMPLERPRMPLASPHSNAEMEWLMQQFPKETAADSMGLALATFGTSSNPQLNWTYWSRSSEDRIPWGESEPRAAVGADKGRLILKGGKCYTVFDTAPRPQLFGGGRVEAIVWAVHLSWHAGMSGVKDFLVAGDSSRAYGPAVPSLAYGEYQGFISREAVPFQEELDALAKLVPASFLAHTGFKEGDDLSGMTLIPPGPDGAGFIATAKEGTKAVGGASLTILSSNEKGMLRYVPSRALLMLERQGWKDGQPQRRRVKYPE